MDDKWDKLPKTVLGGDDCGYVIILNTNFLI